MTNLINHWVIHWFLIDRDEIALTNVEQFHLKIFEKYKNFILSSFDKITVSFAKTEKTDPMLIQYIERTLEILFDGKEIDFKTIDNNQRVGEFETFRDNVLSSIGTNEKILYTHIKGVYRTKVFPSLLKKELIWIWKMYQVVLNVQALKSLDDYIMCGPDFSIYDSAFHTIKTGKWNPLLHIYRTYTFPLKKELEKNKGNAAIDKYVENLPDLKNKSPWAYLGTFYWINMERFNSYIKDKGFSKNDIIAIANEFQKYDRPSNMHSATTNLDGHVVKMTFANNVSEYFLPSIVDAKECSFLKLKE